MIESEKICIECDKQPIDVILFCKSCIRKYIKDGIKIEELEIISIEYQNDPLYREIADALLTHLLQANPIDNTVTNYMLIGCDKDNKILSDLCYILEVYSYANLLDRNQEIVKLFKPVLQYCKLKRDKMLQLLYNMIYYKIQNDDENMLKINKIIQDDYHNYMRSAKKQLPPRAKYMTGLMYFAASLTKADEQKITMMLQLATNLLSCTAPIILHNSVTTYMYCYENKRLDF